MVKAVTKIFKGCPITKSCLKTMELCLYKRESAKWETITNFFCSCKIYPEGTCDPIGLKSGLSAIITSRISFFIITMSLVTLKSTVWITGAIIRAPIIIPSDSTNRKGRSPSCMRQLVLLLVFSLIFIYLNMQRTK